jgi:hypothetical protein
MYNPNPFLFGAASERYKGRVDEALALYDPILSLGPVVARNSR